MADHDHPTGAPNRPEEHPTGAPPAGANLGAPTPSAPESTPPAATEESTVGTGTSIALGCVIATVLLILIGLVFIGIAALIG